MNSEVKKVCGNCGKAFVCNASMIEQCWCRLVKLTGEEREKLANEFQDCICADCMKWFFDGEAGKR